METLKVSASSNPKGVAGAIAAVVRRGESVEVSAIGAGAVNQAVKSICVARSFVSEENINLVAIPAFQEIEVDGETKTSIRFIVEAR
ncbi:MAG: stage V sporulation protein S [Defluviitaleaceae bacterium]|nr:stage V sporulation protein S [Defluviitaleaceae bacterium]MCL2835125.1 stage V sporulation protein S [Defluviitaleaceae bacterium]